MECRSTALQSLSQVPAAVPIPLSLEPGIHWDRIILQGWRPSSDALRVAAADLGAVVKIWYTIAPKWDGLSAHEMDQICGFEG